jgi:MFS family permease
MLFMGTGMFCYGLVDAAAPGMIILPALLTGTGHGLMFHTMTSLTIERFPDPVRGTGSALALMMLDLGMMSGAPALGQLAERWGFVAMFLTIGGLLWLTAGAYAISSIPVWRARRSAASETGTSAA